MVFRFYRDGKYLGKVWRQRGHKAAYDVQTAGGFKTTVPTFPKAEQIILQKAVDKANG